MDDIVTRLRQFGDSNGLDAEAADEIERLRTALQLAVGKLSTYNDHRFISPEQLYEHFLKETNNTQKKTMNTKETNEQNQNINSQKP